MTPSIFSQIAFAQKEIKRLEAKTGKMKQKTTKQIILSLQHFSLGEIERLHCQGYFTDYEKWVHSISWHWLTIRLSSEPQGVFLDRHGIKALVKRINEFRELLGLEEMG